MNPSATVDGAMRQMIAVLEEERQALAILDLDMLAGAVREKEALCDMLEPMSAEGLSAETRTLAATARQLNDVNRRVRNLLAANVAARLEALGVPQESYHEGRLKQLSGRAKLGSIARAS